MKLAKSLSRGDVVSFLVCTLVGLDTLGSVAAHGGEGFVWLAFLAAAFFVPYALLTAELGAAFPDEGGVYVWTKYALGKQISGIVTVFYWVSNPIWLGGALTITALSTWNTFFFEVDGVGRYVFGLALIWGSVACTVLSFGVGKWVPVVGAWARILLLGFFTLSVILYACVHGVHGVSLPAFVPSYAGFFAVVPLLFFNFVGFELPSAAGDEMVDPKRDVPYAVGRSALASVLCYGVPVLAILIVVPTGRITGLKGFIDAMQTVFTVYGGHLEVAADGSQVVTLTGAGKLLGGVAALGFIITLATSGITWIMGADRSQAVACNDGAGPRGLGRFDERLGTPVALNVASGLIATAVMVGAFAVAGGSAEKFFAASLNLGISTTTISYLGVFPALYLLRRQRPEVPRPYRVPGGDAGAFVISALTFGWASLAAVCLLWPGFGRGAEADLALPDAFLARGADGVVHAQRLLFELTQFVPILAFLGLGFVFLALGRRGESVATRTAPRTTHTDVRLPTRPPSLRPAP